jgi:uncharacterized protein YprB with RNaseH-like and TPR domain
MSSPAKKKITADEELPPKTWWQWVILYPALFLAIITAMPQWVQMVANWKSDLPLEDNGEYKEQGELYRKNLPCSTRPLDDLYVTPNKLKVDATICASGDILVRMFTPENSQKVYWLDVEKLVETKVVSILTGQAFAGELKDLTIAQNLPQDTSQGSVICQKFIDDRNLLRVVNLNGACFDEVVDTFRGVTVSQTPSQCRSTC